eukprot:2632195-Prymnesium_polylepis.1
MKPEAYGHATHSQVSGSNKTASEKLQRAIITVFTGQGAAAQAGQHGPASVIKKVRERAPAALVLILVMPFDTLLWPSVSSQDAIPFVRLTRFFYGLTRVHRLLVSLERSQAAPFTVCRMIRVLLFFLVATHCLASAFFYFCTRPEASHYAVAPWLSADALGSRYLRSMYWSLMTFTTTGHVDIVDSESQNAGRDWEVFAAIVVAIIATFVYIYINANFTTMMIQLNSRLMEYRAQLAGVDDYLKRNKVSRDVCKRVKRHIARTHTGTAEKQLFDNLPPSLQRDVLQDIHMRTLRRYLRWVEPRYFARGQPIDRSSNPCAAECRHSCASIPRRSPRCAGSCAQSSSSPRRSCVSRETSSRRCTFWRRDASCTRSFQRK